MFEPLPESFYEPTADVVAEHPVTLPLGLRKVLVERGVVGELRVVGAEVGDENLVS